MREYGEDVRIKGLRDGTGEWGGWIVLRKEGEGCRRVEKVQG